MPCSRDGSTLAQIRAAREADVLLDLEAVCDNPACAVRVIEVFAKDYDGTLLTALEPLGGLLCPVCGYPTVLQTVRPARAAHHQRGELTNGRT